MTQHLQQTSVLSLHQLCHSAALPYGTLLRWRGRARAALPMLSQPGPKKLGALPLAELLQEIALLPHQTRRSRGSGALYRRHHDRISRRALAGMVARQRHVSKQRRRRQIIRVHWKLPNLAWAIDATEYGRDQAGRKLYLIVVKDLASRYLFEPLVTVEPRGEQVASYLGKLLQEHGVPLLLKRDNGSLFNCEPVDQLLAQQAVIPLNSPAYYPPYNGGIENGIRELKQSLTPCLPSAPEQWEPAVLAPSARAITHLRNCRPRRGLRGQSAAQAYHHQPRARFDRRARHETFEWLRRHAHATMQPMEKTDRRALHAAWRHAVETWLRCQGLISLTRQPQGGGGSGVRRIIVTGHPVFSAVGRGAGGGSGNDVDVGPIMCFSWAAPTGTLHAGAPAGEFDG